MDKYDEMNVSIARLAQRAKAEPSGKQCLQLSQAAEALARARDICKHSDRCDVEHEVWKSHNPYKKVPKVANLTPVRSSPTHCHICEAKLEGTVGLDNLHCPDAEASIWMDKLATDEPTYCN